MWLSRNVPHVWDGGFRLRTKVFGHAGLADIDAELEQLAVNARRTPPAFSRLIRRIRSRMSRETAGRPLFPLLIFHDQNIRNALRCQATTVSGLTTTSAERQPDQARE